MRSLKRIFRPRSAILTLYGDYLLDSGDEVGIGSLITLLASFGLSGPAVRSAVERMCRAGLLRVRRRGYYSLTPKGHSLLSKGAQRIFVRKETGWDGTWNIVTYSIPERTKKTRDILRRELIWMGYGTAAGATMISPYDLTREVTELAERLGATDYVRIFQAREKGPADAKKIVSTCWDLALIHKRYASFIAKYRPRFENWAKRLLAGETVAASEFFVERFALIHEYRKLPFYDPDLPVELLPGDWLRPEAATLFQQYHDLLNEKANEYFNSVLASQRT